MSVATRDAVIQGKVTHLKRMQRSVNGNPRFEVTITDLDGIEHVVTTEPDSILAYGIENAEYRDEAHTWPVSKRGYISKHY